MNENRKHDGVSLIVLEAGGVWPAWIAELQSGGQNSIVEAQLTSESPTEFFVRVARRLQRLESEGLDVRASLIATNGVTDPETSGARSMLARRLLSAMAPGNCGELTLVADDDADEATRYELFALAGALWDELAGTELNVRVRFTARQGSGVVPVHAAREHLESMVESG